MRPSSSPKTDFLKLVNPKAVELTGYDQETLQIKPFPELIHPEDRAMVVDRHRRRTRGEDPPSVYCFRMVDREGQVKWVETQFRAYRLGRASGHP